jgi:hypothetical protein
MIRTYLPGERRSHQRRYRPSNKGMKLTKLSAAWLPAWTCRLMPAPSRSDAGTASQLIPGVRRTFGGTTNHGLPGRGHGAQRDWSAHRLQRPNAVCLARLSVWVRTRVVVRVNGRMLTDLPG